MLLVTSVSLDPFWNLAVEDHLLDLVAVQGPTLFLWQSHDTVVIGKNQNPWRESNQAYLRKNEIQLARRISGGGAVYHDAGNLNYSFFCTRDGYRQEEAFNAVMHGLRSLNIPVDRLGKSSLATEGRKFSGTAFCYRRQSVMHHGTLLVNTNLDRLRASLAPIPLEVHTHAVASQPAQVVNLAERNPAWDVKRIGGAVIAGFEQSYGTVDARQCSDDLQPDRMLELHHRFCSLQWRLGKTPPFSVRLREADHDVTLQVRQGKIHHVTSLPGGAIPWEKCLNVEFDAEAIANAIDSHSPSPSTLPWLHSLGL